MAVARAWRALGRPEKALAAYEAVRERHTYSETAFAYGEVLWETGRRDEAVRIMTQIIADAPGAVGFDRARERKWARRARRFRRPDDIEKWLQRGDVGLALRLVDFVLEESPHAFVIPLRECHRQQDTVVEGEDGVLPGQFRSKDPAGLIGLDGGIGGNRDEIDGFGNLTAVIDQAVLDDSGSGHASVIAGGGVVGAAFQLRRPFDDVPVRKLGLGQLIEPFQHREAEGGAAGQSPGDGNAIENP